MLNNSIRIEISYIFKWFLCISRSLLTSFSATRVNDAKRDESRMLQPSVAIPLRTAKSEFASRTRSVCSSTREVNRYYRSIKIRWGSMEVKAAKCPFLRGCTSRAASRAKERAHAAINRHTLVWLSRAETEWLGKQIKGSGKDSRG